MIQYTIKYAGFDSPQQEAISAILDLADSALTSSWVIIDHTDCDVLMINFDAAEGRDILMAEKPNRPAWRFVLVTDSPSAIEMDQHWFLAKKRHAPPSLKELTKLLNEVAIVLAEEAVSVLAQAVLRENGEKNLIEAHATSQEQVISIHGEQSTPKEPLTAGADDKNKILLATLSRNTVPLTKPLYARNYFFGTLLQARKDNACRVLKLNRLPTLYLSPTENSYYFSGSASDLLAYCTATPQYLEEVIVTKTKLAKMLKSSRPDVRALDAFIVYAVIEVSQGRLLESHSAEQPVTLMQMPDTDKIPMLADYKNIAEFMHNKPVSLFQVAEALQIRLPFIFEFYNVCFLLGYFTLANPTKVETATLEQKKPGPLSHFLKTIFSK